MERVTCSFSDAGEGQVAAGAQEGPEGGSRTDPKACSSFGSFQTLQGPQEHRERMDILPGAHRRLSFCLYSCVYYRIEREANSGWYFIFAKAHWSLLAGLPHAPLLTTSPLDLSQHTDTHPTANHSRNNPGISYQKEISRPRRDVFHENSTTTANGCYEKRCPTQL